MWLTRYVAKEIVDFKGLRGEFYCKIGFLFEAAAHKDDQLTNEWLRRKEAFTSF